MLANFRGKRHAPVFALLEEISFGHKPTISYPRRKSKPDTALIRDAAEELVKGESVENVMEKLEPVFPVYHDLKINYARLIEEQKNR
jgi:hypothetical protein